MDKEELQESNININIEKENTKNNTTNDEKTIIIDSSFNGQSVQRQISINLPSVPGTVDGTQYRMAVN